MHVVIPENIIETLRNNADWQELESNLLALRLEISDTEKEQLQIRIDGSQIMDGFNWKKNIERAISGRDEANIEHITFEASKALCVITIQNEATYNAITRLVSKVVDRHLKSYIFFNELTWLNTNLFIIEKWKTFPWSKLRVYHAYRTFADAVFKNFFENSILMIRRLYFETSTDFLSLRYLKNEIMSDVSQEIRLKISSELKVHEKALGKFSKKINSTRNLKLAHLSLKILGDAYKNYNLSLLDLKDIALHLDKYYNLLADIGWNVQTSVLIPIDYHHELGQERTDIERLLDIIATSSELLSCKEDNPKMWESYERQFERDGSRVEMINLINDYRTRILNLEPIE